MHGILGQSRELHVPHFQRLVKRLLYQRKYLILFRHSSHDIQLVKVHQSSEEINIMIRVPA